MKMTIAKLGLLAGGTLLYGLLGTTSAYAARFESRDFNPGDGLITYDSELGIEWLDVSVTGNKPYNYIESGYGGNWRNPTSTEITSLKNYFTVGSYGKPMANLFGFSQASSTLSYTYGFTGERTLVNGQYQYRFVGSVYYNTNDYTGGILDRTTTTITKSAVGVFLVRPYTAVAPTLMTASFAAPVLASIAAPNSLTPNSQSVPEPLTIGGALMALGWGTYFKKKFQGKNNSKDQEN